jgi:hypothetical protein
MNLSRDSVLALQRHFLGALSVPARTWLEPLPAPRLAFAGSALRRSRETCVLDFGTVETPGEERRTLRVFHTGPEQVDVRLGDFPSWLEVRWRDRTSLELLARHATESEFRGSLRFVVDRTRVEELAVRMTTRRSQPSARFDFNGSPAPRPFDFGSDDRPYQVSVSNDASVPLLVSFADLPEWLTFEVDGHRRSGPLPGRFFERAAPFTVRMRPQLLGRYDGAVRMQTNDPRPGMQEIDLRFAGCVEPARPFVRAFAPPEIRLRADQRLTADARLENWGRSPARAVRKMTPRGVDVPALVVVPAARDGRPGSATLPIRVIPAQLAPGTHILPLAVRIEDGDPAEVELPVRVEVSPADPRGKPWRAAILALLLFTLVLFAVRGLP